MKIRPLLVIMTFCLMLCSCTSNTESIKSKFPNVTVWAWDAPADLTFLSSTREAVALYAGTIVLGDDNAYLKPGSKLVKIPAGKRVFPSFRIETRGKVKERASAQIDGIVAIISDYLANHAQIGKPVVQIDFDATAGERDFYRALLKQMRSKLHPETRISVTALASWCLGDRWLSREYADEAVVMLFSMGAGKEQILKHILKGELSAGKDIDLALGLSANETGTNAILLKDKDLFSRRQLYLFNSLPWTEKTLRRTEKDLCNASQN